MHTLPKTLVVLQSNYLPWRGYFDLMRHADVFVTLDVVQYTKNDWRNRNRIMTESGARWLTIPVKASLAAATPIDEVRVADPTWCERHVSAIRNSYRHAAAFKTVSPWLFAQLESVAREELLTVINHRLLLALAGKVGITTKLMPCSELIDRRNLIEMQPNERLLALCEAVGATRYLSGPAAKSYLDIEVFAAKGIDVAWMSYEGYPPYPQLSHEFDPYLSIIDLLLNVGEQAERYFPEPESHS
jgi:WbqC-like protein family